MRSRSITQQERDRGARGSYSLKAGIDTEWRVEKDRDGSTVTLLKMKDGEDGLSWHFRAVRGRARRQRERPTDHDLHRRDRQTAGAGSTRGARTATRVRPVGRPDGD